MTLTQTNHAGGAADLGELERLVAHLRYGSNDNNWRAAAMLENLSERLRAAEGALREIAALPDMSKNPVDAFDRGARAARLDAADIARAVLPIVGGS